MCWGGRHGIAKEAYLKAGVYLRQGNEKEWTTKLVIYFKYAPSHLHTFLSTQAEGGVSSTMARPAEHAAGRKHVDQRGLGAQKKGFFKVLP